MRALLIGLLLLGGAATGEAAEPLTWEACVREAAQHNPDLAAAHEATLKARAQYRGSYSPLLPQLSAAAGYTDSKTSTQSKEYTAGVSARQSLFSGLKNEGGVQKSRADLEAAEAALAVIKAQVNFDLKNAYAQLLFAQQQAELTEVIASRRQENVRLIELRFESGREPKGSYLRSRALYRQADFEISQAARNLRVAQRRLAKVLGHSEVETFAVQDLSAAWPGPAPDFRALALAAPVRLQAAAEARAAQAGVTIAKSELFPDVSAVGSLGRQGSTWSLDQTTWSAGLALSYPFWPGGQNLFDVRSATAEARRSQQTLRSTEDQTAVNLEQIFSAFQDAAQHVDVQREFLEAARVRAEIAREQYALGLLSFQDWDTIESDLITNQKTMLGNLRDALIAQAAWEQVQGKGALS